MKDHLSADEREAYSLDRAAPDVARNVEEHLLICDLCRDRLVGEDVTAAAIRAAFRAGRESGSAGNSLVTFRLENPSRLWTARISAGELLSLRQQGRPLENERD